MTIRELLNIKLPIIQAPMAGVQDHQLAVAVCKAGGLGSLPCGMLTPDAVRREVAAIRANTNAPFNLNFFCHAHPKPDPTKQQAWQEALTPYYQEYGVDDNTIFSGAQRVPFGAETAELLAELQPPVVSFHFGLPAPDLLAKVKSLGCKILASATTVQEAVWLEERGVDAIIAQGVEAGGHRGMFLSGDLSSQVDGSTLLQQLLQAVTTPVIAAGGIADADGVRVAMNKGAAGVQIGTAYLLCPEATTSQVHRAALQSEAASRTAIPIFLVGVLLVGF